jgi:hypothetical protein
MGVMQTRVLRKGMLLAHNVMISTNLRSFIFSYITYSVILMLPIVTMDDNEGESLLD